MATNHFERQSIAPPTIYNQQFFVVCGPVPAGNSGHLALQKLWREHWLGSLLVAAFGLYLAGSWWAMYDYAGAPTLFAWRCEWLAGGLSLLTLFLFCKFRRWGRERVLQDAARRERSEEIKAWLCTPPPLPASVQSSPKQAFAITIEHWTSNAPTRLSEEHLRQAQLPDEFIAPDALVLNFEVRSSSAQGR